MDYHNTEAKLTNIVNDLGAEGPVTRMSVDRECLERGVRYSSAEIAQAIIDAAHEGRANTATTADLVALRRYLLREGKS